MLPIAPHHLALEAATGADRHRQNITRLWDGLELDLFAESNVTVCDGFLSLRPLAADADANSATVMPLMTRFHISSCLTEVSKALQTNLRLVDAIKFLWLHIEVYKLERHESDIGR